MTAKTRAELETEMAELRARVAELEKADKPPEPVAREPHQPLDLTARATMPPAAMRDLINAVPDNLVRDIRADAARGNPITQSVAQLSQDRAGGRVQIRGSGWANPNPLSPPAGVDICDRLVDAQDRQDRADLERRLARSVRKE
jgi:hypothetical protein